MIIDVHYHLMPSVTEKSVSRLMPLVARRSPHHGKGN